MSSILLYKYTLLTYNAITPLCVSGKRATERESTGTHNGYSIRLETDRVTIIPEMSPRRSTEFKLGVHEHHRFL
jgi:hypothetical protein